MNFLNIHFEKNYSRPEIYGLISWVYTFMFIYISISLFSGHTQCFTVYRRHHLSPWPTGEIFVSHFHFSWHSSRCSRWGGLQNECQNKCLDYSSRKQSLEATGDLPVRLWFPINTTPELWNQTCHSFLHIWTLLSLVGYMNLPCMKFHISHKEYFLGTNVSN